MNLVVNHRVIDAELVDILKALREESGNYYFDTIIKDSDDLKVTCPFHANGKEKKAACYIYAKHDGDMQFGRYHCFACSDKEHSKGNLVDITMRCLGCDKVKAEEWLSDKFGGDYLASDNPLFIKINPPPSDDRILSSINNDNLHMDESVLDRMESYHPYMEERKLTKEVVEKFKIRFDRATNSLVFPVWDILGNLVFLTRRRVDIKRFDIPKGMKKPPYLLNFIIKEKIQTVVVCESQIDALYCWTFGIPAIALFGTGSEEQYETLYKYSSIKKYILAFDNDDAGRCGRDKFIDYFYKKSGISISWLSFPDGKNDVNNLSMEELFNAREYIVK